MFYFDPSKGNGQGTLMKVSSRTNDKNVYQRVKSRALTSKQAIYISTIKVSIISVQIKPI